MPRMDLKAKTNYILTEGLEKDLVVEFYEAWAPMYDNDKGQVTSEQNVYYTCLLDKLINLYPDERNIRVLDLGSGTGRMGAALKQLGFTNMDALDASGQMLEVSKSQEIYHNYYELFLDDQPIPIASDTYDVLFSIGLFVVNHANEDCLEELLRITKPGGRLVIMTHQPLSYPHYTKSFKEKVNLLEAAGLLKVHDITEINHQEDHSNLFNITKV